jgi:hypothetical protein
MRGQTKSRPKSAANGQHSEAFGTEKLCTWTVGPGTCRFQTRSPEFARKLGQRSGARLVGESVNGGYLRIYQEKIEPWRARQLVTRYLAIGTPPNGAISPEISPPASQKSQLVSAHQETIT